jgi:hypothetical protein
MTRGLLVNRHGGAQGNQLGGNAGRSMGRLTIFLVIVLVLAVLGGSLFLTLWDFSVPSIPVERVLPDARFPK